MPSNSSKTILFESKTIERYPYPPIKDKQQNSREVITKVINEALKDIEFQYARATCYGDIGSTWYYNIEYWD